MEPTAPSTQADAGAAMQTARIWQSSSTRLVLQVAELAGKVQRWETGRLDVDSQTGRDAMTDFLLGLDALGRRLKVTPAPRAYHEALSERVRASWTDPDSLYSISILTRSVHGAVFFNSQEHPLSRDTKEKSCQVGTKIDEICRLLDRLRTTPVKGWKASDKAALQQSLVGFDAAWVSFEECFFTELPGIEADAQAVLMEAVNLVQELDRLAAAYEEDVDPKILMENPEFVQSHNQLIDSISRLNSVANPNSTGRTFGPEVLRDVEALVEEALDSSDTTGPIFSLAADAVRAWDDLCCHLFSMPQCMESLSPDLSQNVVLVGLLVAWESSWTLADAYIVDRISRAGLCGLVGHIRESQTTAPDLVDMLDQQSAELFIVLPRLVWLMFMENPVQMTPLLKPLLPHRFGELSRVGPNDMTSFPNAELVALMNDYKQTWNALVSAAAAAEPDRRDVQSVVQALLTASAVAGASDAMASSARQRVFEGPIGKQAQESCRSFLCKLESWSMELQRHSAKDWNRFAALLLWCVNKNEGGHEESQN